MILIELYVADSKLAHLHLVPQKSVDSTLRLWYNAAAVGAGEYHTDLTDRAREYNATCIEGYPLSLFCQAIFNELHCPSFV